MISGKFSMSIRFFVLALVLGLAGCVPSYTLVQPGQTEVAKKALTVQPTTSWNRIPKGPGDTAWEEAWTKNGPLLDTVAFVGGLPDGDTLVRQEKKADKKVPTFRADMSPQDLVSMIESSYRIGGISVFEIAGVEPTQFVGQPAIKMDYSYVPSDGLPRRGRCVMSVADSKLYLMKLEGAASHYFDASVPEFEAMVGSASLR